MKWGIAVLSALGIVFTSSGVFADKIHVKNGDVLSGRIISFENKLCIFETQYDSIAKIKSNDIAGIETTDKYIGTLSSGEKIKMNFTYEGNRTIGHTDYGNIYINPSTLAGLTRVVTTKNTKEKNDAEKQPASYGTEAKKEAPLDFLTGSTVLLAPGSWQAEVGLAYKKNKMAYALSQIDQFQMSSYEARRVDLNLGVRAGLLRDLEGWFSVPFSYLHVKDVSLNAFVRSDDSLHIGDIQGGLQYALFHETAHLPSVAVNFSVSAPTGEKRYLEYIDSWRNALSNGSGHWMLSPGLSFVKTTDPAILFAGINYQYAFKNKIDGYEIQPGWGFDGYFGVGFALNEDLSLGTRLSFGYYDDMYVDGTRIEGSSNEPLDLGFTVSYRVTDDIVATPYVNWGINDDAGPAAVGINFTKSF